MVLMNHIYFSRCKFNQIYGPSKKIGVYFHGLDYDTGLFPRRWNVVI